MNKVKMNHPDLTAEIEVPASAVPIHMASGWKPVDGKAPIAQRATPDAKAAKITPPKES